MASKASATKWGIGALAAGALFVATSLFGGLSVSADAMGEVSLAINALKVAFFVGVALIVVSAILFIVASSIEGKQTK